MISPSDIRYFLEIAQTRNLSRAAERLGISQPALTYSLARMEKELSAKLLVRSKKGVTLTSSGEVFLAEARNLGEQWAHLRRSVQEDLESPRGLIRLGCHTAVSQYSLPRFLPAFLRDFPKIRLELRHGLSRHMTAEVISSQLDVAIAVNPVPHPDLVIRELCRDVVTLWRSKKCLNPGLLILDPGLLQSQDLLKRLARAKIVFDNFLETPSLEVIAQLVESGAGAAILPGRVIRAFVGPDVEQVRGAPEYQDRICLVFKPEFKRLKRGQVFTDAITKVFPPARKSLAPK
jgi:LysR family transcriptional regulator, cell division regulator